MAMTLERFHGDDYSILNGSSQNAYLIEEEKTGDSIDIGNGKKLVFVEMQMLHWPDSMATFMTGESVNAFRKL